MPKFGKESLQKLATCDAQLQLLCRALIQHTDFSVVFGHRNEDEQNKAYSQKRSTKKWPDSKHNTYPSIAVDIVPYEGRQLWGNNTKELLAIGRLIGMAEQVARELGGSIRCGYDWDGDGQITDTNFVDAFHIELEA